MIDDNANLIERIDYNPYGEARHHWKADVDGDGDHDTTDRNLINALTGSGGTPITSANYNVDCDLDRNGIINSTDYTLSSGSNAALTKGKLSTVGNVFGFSGYVYNAEPAIYTVHFRHYDVTMGRWLERDPLGYVDGMGLYEYVGGMPLRARDPLGMAKWEWHHIIPQRFFKEGAILEEASQWMHNEYNGTWLTKQDHIETFTKEYEDFILSKLKTLKKGSITQKQLKTLIKAIVKDKDFRRVFKNAVATNAQYTARVAKGKERLKLRLFAFLALLGITYEAYASSEKLQDLFNQFNATKSHDRARWIAEDITLVVAKLWGSAALGLYEKLMEAHSNAMYQEMLDMLDEMGNIDSRSGTGYTSWDPTAPKMDAVQPHECFRH